MNETPIQRCGFCGRYFQGDKFLTQTDIDEVLVNGDSDDIYSAGLGYCPDAPGEQEDEEPERHQVTRDMAIDAGDPSLEGQWI